MPVKVVLRSFTYILTCCQAPSLAPFVYLIVTLLLPTYHLSFHKHRLPFRFFINYAQLLRSCYKPLLNSLISTHQHPYTSPCLRSKRPCPVAPKTSPATLRASPTQSCTSTTAHTCLTSQASALRSLVGERFLHLALLSPFVPTLISLTIPFRRQLHHHQWPPLRQERVVGRQSQLHPDRHSRRSAQHQSRCLPWHLHHQGMR